MSHHGKNPFEDAKMPPAFKADMTRNERIRTLLDTAGFKGALGTFPQNKITKEDEGAIQFAIGSKDDKVIVDFGTPVHWLGMSPHEAAELASALMKKAREVGRRNGETVTLVI